MNILFISSLYPTQPAGSGEEITPALHHLAKYWNQTENVLIIRPVYYYLRELFTPHKNHQPGFFQRWRHLFHHRMFELDGVKIVVFPILKIPKIAYFYSPLYRFLDHYQKTATFTPDIIVAHYNKNLDIGYQYSIRHRLPLVVGIHAAPDVSDDNPTAFTARCGHILEAAARIACRSSYIYNKIGTWFPAYSAKGFIAFSGIEEEIISDKSLAINKLNRWKTTRPTGKISIITVSSLITRKHIDSNLQALAHLPDSIDWAYTIIGDGPERRPLETLAQSLGIHPRVCFKGNKTHPEVMAQLCQADIFIMISAMESFGLVYLEAMAAGNIVIAAIGEGIDGIIQNGHNGFLSPAGQAEPLAVLLADIVQNKTAETLATLLGNANDTIRAFTQKKAAQHYLLHLKNIIKKEKSQ